MLNALLGREEVHDRGFREAAARLLLAARGVRSGCVQGMDRQDAGRREGAGDGRGWDAMLRKESAAAAHLHHVAGSRRSEGHRRLSAARGAAAVCRGRSRQGDREAHDGSGRRLGGVALRAHAHAAISRIRSWRSSTLPTVERSGGNGAVGADGAIVPRNHGRRGLGSIGRRRTFPANRASPRVPFYGNLLPLWDKGEYFPMVFSRARVDREAAHRLTLKPPAASSSAQR